MSITSGYVYIAVTRLDNKRKYMTINTYRLKRKIIGYDNKMTYDIFICGIEMAEYFYMSLLWRVE